MNLTIETLNLWGARTLDFVWPLLWQSSLLIGVLFAVDVALRHKVRAAVRYALWLVVLLKLLLPPALALPTGAAWWLRPAKPAPAVPPIAAFTVTYGPVISSAAPTAPVPAITAPVHPSLSRAGWALVASGAVSFGLLVWMLRRSQQVARDVRQAAPAEPALLDLLEETRKSIGLRRSVRLGLTQRDLSPAVCGLFSPRILLPRSLAQQLSPTQLRAVLLHELIHLRRGDVWINCAQALFQILYWWHPLLWLANARIRQVREEAVDDAVMAALREDAESYAPTLLEVARLALQRPLNSLGLVGILESRSSLRQRIERLVELHPPRTAGLTLASALTVLAFAAVAVPMGEAPAPKTGQVPTTSSTNGPASSSATNAVPVEQKLRARRLLHEGVQLYQMGKMDEALSTLREAARCDPQNQAAYYYLNLASEASGAHRLRSPDGQQLPRQTGRQAIYHKLQTIVLDDKALQEPTLGQAIRFLNNEIIQHSPDKRGINFILVPSTNSPVITAADLASVHLGAKPFSTDLALEQVLDAMVKIADRPVQYAIEDYGIVFSPRVATAPALFTRKYAIDPDAFRKILSAGTNAPAQPVSKLVREFFATLGLELNPPKSVYYNEREGRLYVRAEVQDLDSIEDALHVLNAPNPTRPSPAANLKSDPPWYLGQFLATSAPPQIHLQARIIEVSEAQVAAFRSQFGATNIPGSQSWGTMLAPGQEKHLLDQWSDQGANILAAPEVTTMSGRQAQTKATQTTNVVFADSYRFERVSGSGSTSTWLACTNSAPQTNAIEVGSTIDLFPTLLDDGFTVRLHILAYLSEFLGYESPASQGSSPRPSIRLRDLGGVTAFVRDGQTLVLGGPVTEDSASGRKVHLLVLVTPRLITPAGNTLHDNETLEAVGQSKLPLEAPPVGWSQVKPGK